MTNGTQPPTDNQPSPGDLQNQIDLVKKQLELYQEQWKLATAPLTGQLEILSKLFPQGQAAPPGSTITATGGEKWGFGAGIIAYQVVGELVERLMTELNRNLVQESEEEPRASAASQPGVQKAPKVLIVDKLEYALEDLPLAEVKSSFALFKKELEEKTKKITDAKSEIEKERDRLLLGSALVALAAVPPIISTLAGVAGSLQTTRTITGQEFALPQEGLVAAVASKLRDKKVNGRRVKVYVSNFYAIGRSELLDTFMQLQEDAVNLKKGSEELAKLAKPLNDQSALLNQQIAVLNQHIRDLESQKTKLDSAANQPEIEKINSEIEKSKNEVGKVKGELKPIQEGADQANAAIQAADVVHTAFENFTKGITTSADGTQPTKLARAILRNKVYQEDITHILYLSIIFSGGYASTDDRKIRDDKITYAGGAAVAFFLATTDGELVASGKLEGMREYDSGAFRS